MQIRHVEMNQRRFQQVIDLGIFMDKRDQFSHAFWQRLPRKARVFYLCADNIDAVMSIEIAGK